MEAHIDVFEPGRRLRLIYLPSAALPPTDDPLVDDFMIDARDPATIVRLLGSGVPPTEEWNKPYQRLRLGWQQAMTRLKVFTEKRVRSKAT